MRTLLLVILEVAALFGIPRLIYELREALGETATPVVMAVNPVKNRQAARAPARAASAGKADKTQHLKDSPPVGGTVANLQTVQPNKELAKDVASEEAAVASRNDDYLPPWMRGGSADKREAKLSPAPVPIVLAVAVRAAQTGKAAGRVKHVRHKHRRGERKRDARAGRSHRASRGGFAWAGF